MKKKEARRTQRYLVALAEKDSGNNQNRPVHTSDCGPKKL
jgi:hypothetical protein